MAKKWLLILGLILVIGGGLLFRQRTTQRRATTPTDNKPAIGTSFYPLYFFTSEITNDKTAVFNLTPAGVEPHDYDPTPQEIARILESKLLVVNGAGFEPWLDKLTDDLAKQNVIVVETTQGLALMESQEMHEEEAENEEASQDPHVWLSPILASKQVEIIKDAVVEVDRKNASEFERNANVLRQRLQELDKKYRDGLRTCQKRSFVTSHTAFSYLAKEHNLTQVPIAGISPEEEPSPADLAKVAAFAKENNIKYIFFETLVSPKLSETIANEVGAQTLVLDPIEGLSDDDIQQGKNYFTVMEENLKNLRIALECTK